MCTTKTFPLYRDLLPAGFGEDLGEGDGEGLGEGDGEGLGLGEGEGEGFGEGEHAAAAQLWITGSVSDVL